jgi:hypothetical protein
MKSSLVFPLIVLGAASHVSIATAQSASTFTPTGSMTTPRVWHTATLLPDGHVLIAGGRTADQSALASAELYDPSTGTFSLVGQMSTPRARHTATLLADGRVLIAGGNSGPPGGDPAPSAELYDPTTGTFAPTGSMSAARGGHTATLLPDGRVLVAGGYGPAPYLDSLSAELYDPIAGTFTPTGSMHRAWYLAGGATLLADGTVLVGEEVYDPSTGLFADTGHSGHYTGFTTTLLTNGTAFIAGGGDSDWGIDTSQTDLYDLPNTTFAAAPSMTLGRFYHTATLLPSGIVMIAGGASYDVGPYQDYLASVEIYDFSSGTFGWIGNMIAGRQIHTATLLGDGRVLLAGGVGAPPYTALATAEVYTPPGLVPAPMLFSLAGDGQGQGAVWNGVTGLIVSADNPATTGDMLSMYTTSLVDGGVIPPQVAVGGRLAEILFFGDAPGYPGYFQVNFRMPTGVAPGSAVPVRLTYIGRPSNAVTIGVQ